jgi:hypothetical protein
MKFKLLNILHVSVTMTLGVPIQLLRSAHRLIMVITFSQLLKNISEAKKSTRNKDFHTFDL